MTDANLRAWRLSGETLLAGSLRLDAAAARRALGTRIGAPRPRCARRRPRVCCASSTPRWPWISGSRCRSRGRIRAASRSSPSAARGRFMPATLARSVGDSDRAGAALSRHQLRDGHAADGGAPFLSPLRDGRARAASRWRGYANFRRARGRGAGRGGEEGFAADRSS